MRTILKIILFLSMTCLQTACSTLDNRADRLLLQDQVNIPFVGEFNDRMKNLADQLDKNAVVSTSASTYIVTSFTNLDKLGETTPLGRLIAENLMNGLQLHKWQIYEVRLAKGIDVNANGEFSLSRDINKLRDEYKISGVVTGTYSVAEGNITINARVMDVNTGLLVSSAQTYIPISWLPDLSSKENNHKPIKIVSDGIK
ncbi:MAG: FlgO family outer membrane protein [Desulfuromonadaceae bacterium]|nr:FlgO family outer membrane protein [Desulfuromonadaceae bacterium]MDD2853904.1 FlgO family outer membrane protein [Desulfuromonadaceae bacterium]